MESHIPAAYSSVCLCGCVGVYDIYTSRAPHMCTFLFLCGISPHYYMDYLPPEGCLVTIHPSLMPVGPQSPPPTTLTTVPTFFPSTTTHQNYEHTGGACDVS